MTQEEAIRFLWDALNKIYTTTHDHNLLGHGGNAGVMISEIKRMAMEAMGAVPRPADPPT